MQRNKDNPIKDLILVYAKESQSTIPQIDITALTISWGVMGYELTPKLQPLPWAFTHPANKIFRENRCCLRGLHAFWDVHFPLRPLQWRQNPNSPVIGRNFWHWEGNILASRWVRSFRKKTLLVQVLPFVKHSAFVSLPLTVTFNVSRRAALSPCERGIYSCGRPSQDHLLAFPSIIGSLLCLCQAWIQSLPFQTSCLGRCCFPIIKTRKPHCLQVTKSPPGISSKLKIQTQVSFIIEPAFTTKDLDQTGFPITRANRVH